MIEPSDAFDLAGEHTGRLDAVGPASVLVDWIVAVHETGRVAAIVTPPRWRWRVDFLVELASRWSTVTRDASLRCNRLTIQCCRPPTRWGGHGIVDRIQVRRWARRIAPSGVEISLRWMPRRPGQDTAGLVLAETTMPMPDWVCVSGPASAAVPRPASSRAA